MLAKIVQNKELLNLCLRYASTQTNSNKPTDVFLKFLKIAAGDTSMIKDMLDLPNKQIKEILGRPGRYESKVQELEKVLSNSLGIMSYYVQEAANTPEIQEWATNFMPDKFIPYMLKTKLPSFDGREAAKFSLVGTLNGTLGQARTIANQEKEQINRKQQSITEGEEFGQQLVAPEQIESSGGDESSTDQEIVHLKNTFRTILNDPSQDILSYYIENSLLPEFEKKIQAYDVLHGTQKAKAAADIDAFYDSAIAYISKEFQNRKRDPITNSQEPFSLAEIQTKVNEATQNLDLDNLAEHILQSKFYTLPKKIRKYAEDHHDFVIQTIISVIKTSMVFNIKQELGVSLPAVAARATRGEEGQGGRGPLSAASLLHHIMNKNIKRAFTNKKDQQEYLHRITDMLNAQQDASGKMTYGSGTNFINYGFLDHATPMTYSGIINKHLSEQGENFGQLTPEQQEMIAGDIHQRVHPHMPHAAYKDKYSHSVSHPSKLGPNADQMMRDNIRGRLNAAMKIHRGEQAPGTFMQDMEDPTIITSSLGLLIKKYASFN